MLIPCPWLKVGGVDFASWPRDHFSLDGPVHARDGSNTYSHSYGGWTSRASAASSDFDLWKNQGITWEFLVILPCFGGKLSIFVCFPRCRGSPHRHVQRQGRCHCGGVLDIGKLAEKFETDPWSLSWLVALQIRYQSAHKNGWCSFSSINMF